MYRTRHPGPDAKGKPGEMKQGATVLKDERCCREKSYNFIKRQQPLYSKGFWGFKTLKCCDINKEGVIYVQPMVNRQEKGHQACRKQSE